MGSCADAMCSFYRVRHRRVPALFESFPKDRHHVGETDAEVPQPVRIAAMPGTVPKRGPKTEFAEVRPDYSWAASVVTPGTLQEHISQNRAWLRRSVWHRAGSHSGGLHAETVLVLISDHSKAAIGSPSQQSKKDG